MQVDIYIREKNGTRELRIPIIPEEINYKSGDAEFVTYDIMNRGEVAVPTGVGLSEIGWSCEFPGEGRKNDPMLRGRWQDPKYFHNTLEDWKTGGRTLNVLVVGYPFNFDAHLKSYSAKPAGAFGDIQYEIEFQEARSIVIKTTKVSVPEPKRNTEETTSYTIKKGDTLWGIAEQFLGSGSKWPTIYEANKDIIESTAKKYGYSSSNNGWWIFPGVKLSIPKS